MKKKNNEINEIDNIAEQWARLILAHIEAKRQQSNIPTAIKKGRPIGKNSLTLRL